MARRSATPALRVLAQESRDQRMTAAEKKAAALPPTLTVPMILFFLPGLFCAILGSGGDSGQFVELNASRAMRDLSLRDETRMIRHAPGVAKIILST